MKGQKLDLVLQAINFIIRQLSHTDRLALVTYDQHAAVNFPLTHMNREGRTIALDKVKTIRSGNGTNLCGGLVRGIKVFKEREAGNAVSSLLLFTDGYPTVGKKKSDDILDEISKLEPIPFTVYTFGFKTHDANLLKAISDKGNGIYAFISDKDEIPTAFAGCLGGLLSVVAQNIVIQIQPLNGVTTERPCTSGYVISTLSDSVYSITIGDIQSEEEKDIIFPIRLPKTEPIENDILEVKLTYFDVIHSLQVDKVLNFTLRRDDNVPKKVNLLVDRQKNRMTAADSIAEAKVLGDAKDITRARNRINFAIKKIKSSESATDEYVLGLIRNLEECLGSLKDENVYNTSGNQIMTSYVSSHYQQRATYGVSIYTTTNRRDMQDQLNHKSPSNN